MLETADIPRSGEMGGQNRKTELYPNIRRQAHVLYKNENRNMKNNHYRPLAMPYVIAKSDTQALRFGLNVNISRGVC